jgi:protein-ribulosamine 3-kinase
MDAFIKRKIEERLSNQYSFKSAIEISGVGGGCINETFRITHNGAMFFCKINAATEFPHLFEAEAKGLQLLAQSATIRVPAIVAHFIEGNRQVLLLQWINQGERTDAFWKLFGQQLAALHSCSSEVFGLPEDNYMGSVPQSNKTHINWIDFFVEERLVPLVQQSRSKALISSTSESKFHSLFKKLNSVFPQESKPSLVHGDLWSGNFMCDENSRPVLIDPAVYYGHSCVDLGMSTLFGGFSAAFYDSYHYYSPLPSNHQEQWRVVNLYPLLIHLLLFGRSYLPQIESTLEQFA